MENYELITIKNQKNDIIYGIFYKAKTEKVKANVIIVHGMAEYGLRYLPFMEVLAKDGFNIYAIDHLGHGMQVSKNENAKYGVLPQDGFFQNIENIYSLAKYIKAESNLPIYIFGHSMGSFITQGFYQMHSDIIDKVIVCGSGFNNLNYRTGRVVTACLKPFYLGKRGEKTNKFLIKTGTAAFLKGIDKKENDSPNRWISYSNENVKNYDEDKECGFDCSFNFYYTLFKGQQYIWKKKHLKNIKHVVPLLIIAGEDDPVGDYSKGIKKLEKFYSQIQNEHIKTIIYKHARHEILNEDIKEDVYKDVLEFLNK